ncbi:HdeD family acid-resistance protein [Bifidobacterium tsurumiense]|uniref:HdeD family acid-resistance protein n=1 Tax=Bifidobacterium tsurumiense TaxID=356829 RepID=A0A087EKQ6_9BIFI|nr:HdeD family acid-resistance protein [Bifidobacterium tsurumiense]KFJ08357.1 hypothetical protein BITS_0873 [Bifidobacterium tsurumiense]MDY4678010.1 HdeD family acid-resistance protein [Bifidobacterium tsurumiense]
MTDPNNPDMTGRSYNDNEQPSNQGGQQANDNGSPYGPFASNPQGAPNGNPYAWQNDPFKLAAEQLTNRAKNAVRMSYGVIGAAALIFGIIVLFWPGATLAVIAAAFGIYFVISGIIRIVSAIVELGLPAGWRVLDILVGVLLTVGGIVVLKNAAVSGQTLAIVAALTIGIGWIAEGIMALVETWRLPQSGWAIFQGVISIIAGVVVLIAPLSSTIWMIIFGGAALVVIGITMLIRAFTFGKVR